jgi:hypothetical protein
VTGPSLETFLFGAPIINAKFFRRAIFDQIAPFDTGLSLAADRDFLLRLLLRHTPLRWHRATRQLYRYRIHAGSQTLGLSPTQRLRIAEEHQFMIANLLTTPGLARPTAWAMRALAAREGLVEAVCHAKAGRVGRMLGALSRLAGSDPLFPMRLPAAIGGVAAFRRRVSLE